MKTINVSGASGIVLDWLVAKCEGFVKVYTWPNELCVCKEHSFEDPIYWAPSTNWTQGGPIIERERITFDYHDCNPCDQEDAAHARLSRARMKPDGTASWYAHKRGPTPLIAAMRCYVASKLGDIVEVPEGI